MDAEENAAGEQQNDGAGTPKGFHRGRPFTKGNRASPGRPKGSHNRNTVDAREMAARFLGDSVYQTNLLKRLRAGKAAHLEPLLYHYAYGKPVDRLKVEGALGTFDLVSALREAARAQAIPGDGDGHRALSDGAPP
jgi:hypothetical protein